MKRRATGSSIRVSSSTRARVGNLAARMHASSQEAVIERAPNKLEHSLFWEGFEQEARRYLAAYPQEQEERRQYAGTSADGLRRK